MFNRVSEGRTGWLIAGVFVGLCLAYFWPHEPVSANTSDRNDKFAMITAGISPDLDAIFVLDFLTGRLQGTVLNRQGTGFVVSYIRPVAADFNVNPEAEPKYTISAGNISKQNQGGAQWAGSALYVGELSSGLVICYAIPYRITTRPSPTPVPLIPIANFRFREPMQAE